MTIFKSEKVTLLISDHSKDAEKISRELIKKGIFDEVFFIQTLNGSYNYNRTVSQRIIDSIDIVFGIENNRFNYNIKCLQEKYYDEILIYNYGIETYEAYSVLSKYNQNLSISCFEEGILSYDSQSFYTTNRNLINRIRSIFGKPIIESHLKNFYCFYPSLYHGHLNPIRVPLIESNSQSVGIIKSIFSISESSLSYKYKYIFFTSVYDFEGGEPIGEYNLVCKVADLVGKDNLLIKQHPRDSRTIYKDNGFNVDKNSAIPWEAIQLSLDFSDKVFLTVNSGSVLAGSLMTKSPVKTFYMYKLCNLKNNTSAQKSAKDIYNLLENKEMKDVLKTVKIADSIDDILS